ncbi:MAG: hypothetical protein ACRCV5_06350, partial [Afipia sp.]
MSVHTFFKGSKECHYCGMSLQDALQEDVHSCSGPPMSAPPPPKAVKAREWWIVYDDPMCFRFESEKAAKDWVEEMEELCSSKSKYEITH